MSIDRRSWLRGASALGLWALASGCTTRRGVTKAPASPASEIRHGPGENLVEDHGVLRRTLLVFEEIERRLRTGTELAPEVVGSAARLVRDFIQNHHERMEERFVFPVFEDDPDLEPLLRVLEQQHDVGRELIGRILLLSHPKAMKERASRRELAETIHAFSRMYGPHAAREDTELFPRLRDKLDPDAYRSLSERLQSERIERWGERGYAKAIEEVASLEEAVGIGNLALLLPR